MGQYPIIGRSLAVEHIRLDVARLAKSDEDVLIIGESGVGKGAVARNIFYQGANGVERPFVSINLSVVDDRELEAMLFGFDRGVEGLPYTSKRGLFEQANGGTVVIEEIEEASFRNQMKILNFIDERKTRRIGGDANERVSIRLILCDCCQRARNNLREMTDKRHYAIMLDGRMEDDASCKQCQVIVALAHELAVGDPELAEAYGF